MPTIDELKELEVTPTPLFLFECRLANGQTERWSTHAVSLEGETYAPRLQRHNLFEQRGAADEGLDGLARLSVTLANADGYCSQIERTIGFRGAKLTVRFVFFDLMAGTAASEARVIFRGVGNTADEISEAWAKVSFGNRMNVQRVELPEVRIGRRCPWRFPATASQRQEALSGAVLGPHSALYRCGYSADQAGGVGNLDGAVPFTSCDYTRAACEARGMFQSDSNGQGTRRFGGAEFVPAQILVRSAGEKGSHLSPVAENEARYNDIVPLVYGTAWYQPPIVFARNDGNLTHLEILLGMGEIDDVLKIVVNDVEIPEGVAGRNMTATGWYNVVSAGARNGAFNASFADSSGQPLGDPYGSMAVASVVVPNRVSSGQSLPKLQVLLRGMKLAQFESDGTPLVPAYSNNPAWVLLDVLRRSGWHLDEIEVGSFAVAAAFCGELIGTTDMYGGSATVPRFQCNLVVRNRMSAAELLKGIRAGSGLLLGYSRDGLLSLRVENTLAVQQPNPQAGGNSTEALNGGWPKYEFSDGSQPFSGILRSAAGEPSIRVFSRSGAEVANRLTVEFQDEFNEYQQDSLSLVDMDDAVLTGREVTTAFAGTGLANFDQAQRVLRLQLAKAVRGNHFVEFDTTVRGLGLAPGDLISISYLKEGWLRQPFRVVGTAPGLNFHTMRITAQWHDDDWYTAVNVGALGGRRPSGAELQTPRPLLGVAVDENGLQQFGVTENAVEQADGSNQVRLSVEFLAPRGPEISEAAIPLLSLSAAVLGSGGTLAGGETYYYAVTALDAAGRESGLSFAVRARIAGVGSSYGVRLQGLRFSPQAVAFHVYRGRSPVQLLRIAAAVPVTSEFTDSGYAEMQAAPPDGSYDHAVFYWRTELRPEVGCTVHAPDQIGATGLGMLANEYAGNWVRITRGQGQGQERQVAANTTTVLTVSPDWSIEPDGTSFFTIVEGTWNRAGQAAASPVAFDVPWRPGRTIEISGRSANAEDRESPFELNPLTRWQLGSGASGADGDVPPAPVFGLNPGRQGTVELVGIAFSSLENTQTISAGTLALHSWNELNSPSGFALAAPLTAISTLVELNAAGSVAPGGLLQIDSEILEVQQATGTQCEVLRGAFSSVALEHEAGAKVYPLSQRTVVVPFTRGFFGSPASGTFAYSVFLPNMRIGAAELFMTNVYGRGASRKGTLCYLPDQGLRTLSGGQISLQVESYLAIQTNAAPPFLMDGDYSVRDVFAVVREPAVGGAIELRLRQGDSEYCVLTIAEGATISNIVSGFGLPPLTGGSQLSLDVVAVPGAPNTLPGRDLTVTVRL